MAKAYPNSRFYGFDVHPSSIERARALAEEAGVAERATFAVAKGTDYLGSGTIWSPTRLPPRHGRSASSIAHTRQALAPDGTVMLVEPMAGARVEDNFSPVGQFYSGASVLVCTPNALATGSEATTGDRRRRARGGREGGLSRFRRAVETPLNRIFEARTSATLPQPDAGRHGGEYSPRSQPAAGDLMTLLDLCGGGERRTTMIIRIFQVQVQPGMRGEFERFCARSPSTVTTQASLLQFYVGTPRKRR